MAAVGALALAGCEALPPPSGAPASLPEQARQPIACGLDCGFGRCAVKSGAPACLCPVGRSGARCEACTAGYQDADGDGVCLPDCSMMTGLQCGHGLCSSASGVPRCQCDEGFGGARCEACAPGFQDHDGDGVCAPSCESGAVSCSGYTVCDDASGQPHCICMPGYVARTGGCELSPVVADPTFSFSLWSPVDGALPGLIPAEAVCHGAARLVSTVSLPPVSSPDAFAVTSLVVTPGDYFFPSESRALARVGESMAWLGASELGSSTLACLGEGAQIGQTSFQLSSASLSTLACDPFTNAELRFQQVDVVAAPTCPRVGTVLDGQLNQGAWTLSGEAEVTVVESPELHLWMTDQCSAPRASTVMSVPRTSSLPSPAVRFKMTGDGGRDVLLAVGLIGPAGRAIHANRLRVVAHGGEEIVTRCLPSWTAGSAVALELSMAGNGACSQGDGRQFFFDDFQVVSDPSCASSTAGLFDPSFESDLEQHWELAAASGGLSDAPEAGPSSIGAHSGALSLRLSNARPCLSASARQGSRVPAGVSGAGPAVVGWYRADSLTHSSAALAATVLGAGYELALPSTPDWTRGVLCLPRELAGLPVAIEARQVAEAGLCSDVFPREEIFFDDLEVTTDPSCP